MKIIIMLLFAVSTFVMATAQSKNDQVTLNETQTKQIFGFLFGKEKVADLTISAEDKTKAYFFLIELVSACCKMSVVEGITKGALPIKTSISASVADIVKEIIKSSYANCYKGTADGNFYESVRATLARNYKSAFEIRKATGEW